MNIKRIMAVLCCACLLALGLASCSSPEQKAAESVSAFSGTWDIRSMQVGDQQTSEEDFQKLRDLDLEVFLIFSEDNKVAYYQFGDVEESTWEPIDATSANVVLRGETYEMKIQGDSLVLESGETRLEFAKGESRNINDYQQASSEPAEHEIEPITIADDDVVNITLVSTRVDDDANVGMVFDVTNKLDVPFSISADRDPLIVNGKQVTPLGSTYVQSHTTDKLYVYIDPEELGSYDADALVNVTGVISLVADGADGRLASYPFTLFVDEEAAAAAAAEAEAEAAAAEAAEAEEASEEAEAGESAEGEATQPEEAQPEEAESEQEGGVTTESSE